MRNLLRFAREQVFFVALALVAFAEGPGILNAQTPPDGTVFFTAPTPLTRGELSPASDHSLILTKERYCDLVMTEWGWSNCENIDSFVIDYDDSIDSLIVSVPNSEGYVQFDDWKSKDREDEIRAIEAELREGMRQQSAASGYDIQFSGWRVYPELDFDRHMMFYATDVAWDSEISTNVTAIVFDRDGYIKMSIVPIETSLNSDQIKQLIFQVTDHYMPAPQRNYASFTSGDKVAAVGSVGVLAGVLGVKYGKAAATGLLAIAIALAKKFAFLLLAPVLLIGRLFKRK